ncbi:MAG: hypothetical protein FWG87_12545 [Defluviitaleaceae bacterium]|nr:hypothetical protein [Defluviitaleaceae bacterium]
MKTKLAQTMLPFLPLLLILLALPLTLPVTASSPNEDSFWEQRAKELQEQIDNAGKGEIRLVSPHNITLEAGASQEITITLRNVGTQPVRSLFTIASPSKDAPFTAEFLRNTNSVSSINANVQRTMTMLVTVDENAEHGNHTIALEHFFRDSIGDTITSSDTINVRIGAALGTPNVRLGSFQRTPSGTLSPNQSFTVSANIQNLGTAAARDVRISLPDNSRPADGIFSTGDLNQALFATMEADHSSTLNFTFQTAENIETGAYTIDFHVSFAEEGSDNTRTTAVFPFIVNVYAEDEDEFTTLEIRELTAPVGRISPDETGRISFTVYNGGDIEARNIRITATPEDAVIVPMGTANMQVIPSLAAGESRAVSFNFSPTSRAKTRSYTIRFDTVFDVGRTGTRDEFVHVAAFNVYNPDEDEETANTHIPRVIVSSHKLEPATPRAGEPFEMEITFRNTSNTLSINNMRVLIAEKQITTNTTGQQTHFAGLTPVDGSNTLYIESLAPRGEKTVVLHFNTSADATPGTHNMGVSFDYQDQNFVLREDSVILSFQLAQFMRLELANVNVPETGTVGSPVWFSFRIINSGRVNLSNMRIETEGPFDVTEAERFITPINAQRFAEFDGRFVPLEAGTHRGSFVVRGEDNTGEPIEYTHTFTIEIDEGWGGEFGEWGGDMPEWGEGGGRAPMGRPMEMADGEADKQTSGFARFFQNMFTREVAPEWWDSSEMGEFDFENAPFMGIETERKLRWGLLVGLAVVMIAVIAVPIVVIRKKSAKMLDFDDEV